MSIQTIKQQHTLEKLTLKQLERTQDFILSNPIIINQRTIVRKLKDRVIRSESYSTYLRDYKPYCQFQADINCKGKLNHNYTTWLIHGNCCEVCTAKFNKVKLPEIREVKEEKSSYVEYMEELGELDRIEGFI